MIRKYTTLAAGILLTLGLAGCGSHHDKANMSVQDMVNDPKLLTDENNWCGQQPRPDLIAGCKNADIAQWIMKDPNKMAQAGKPEPWPGKNTAFFVSALKAEMAQKMIPMEEKAVADGGVMKNYSIQQLAQSKTDLSAVPANAIHAHSEEAAWCITQLAFKGQDPWGHKLDFSAASPTCVAESNAQLNLSPF